ncbi:unnamed protein product, partial [Tilletia laevis]
MPSVVALRSLGLSPSCDLTAASDATVARLDAFLGTATVALSRLRLWTATMPGTPQSSSGTSRTPLAAIVSVPQQAASIPQAATAAVVALALALDVDEEDETSFRLARSSPRTKLSCALRGSDQVENVSLSLNDDQIGADALCALAQSLSAHEPRPFAAPRPPSAVTQLPHARHGPDSAPEAAAAPTAATVMGAESVQASGSSAALPEESTNSMKRKRSELSIHVSRSSASQLPPLHVLTAAVRAAMHNMNFIPKPWQVETVYRIIAGMDGVVAAGTGSGKSMVWYYIPLILPKAKILVMTALKKIEKHQLGMVELLRAAGISAVAHNADTLNTESCRRAHKQDKKGKGKASSPLHLVEDGTAQVVFASPEMLFNNSRVSTAVTGSRWAKDLCAIVVDEAHVVYDWGIVRSNSNKAPFRPEFGKLAVLRAKFNSNVPLLAMSATLNGNGPFLPAICTALQFGRLPFFALDVGKERDG